MAKTVALGLAMILSVLLMAPMVRSEREERILNNHSTKTLTVFYEDIFGGPMINFIPVAGAPGQPITLTTFGSFFVTSCLARLSINRDSPVIGRGEGIEVVTSRNGNGQLYLSFSLVFNSGSTMQFQGLFGTEISLVGGTGEYRGVKGYASIETVQQDPNSDILKSVIVYKLYD